MKSHTSTAVAARPRSTARTPRRGYRMSRRADSADATRRRIVEVATRLFQQRPYDEVSLESVCEQGKVSLPTILRNFGSKDGLLGACAKYGQSTERQVRAVTPGDIAAACLVLARRYEQSLPVWRRYLALAENSPVVGKVVEGARHSHLAWLADTFAPYLPARGALRTQRLAELFGATEIYVWASWRESLGLSQAQCRRAMAETLDALVAHWAEKPQRRSHA